MKLNTLKPKDGEEDKFSLKNVSTDAMTYEDKIEYRRLQEEGIERQVTNNISGGDYKKTNCMSKKDYQKINPINYKLKNVQSMLAKSSRRDEKLNHFIDEEITINNQTGEEMDNIHDVQAKILKEPRYGQSSKTSNARSKGNSR